MTRVTMPQVAFPSGEVSELLHRRFDYMRAQTGLRTCRGFLPLAEGGFTRAPGTIFRGYTRGNQPARRITFEFAENDAVTLEFTAGFMRVWRYGQPVLTGGGATFELATPYLAPSLPVLQWTQSADVIYLCDGLQPVQKLSRLALDNWTIAPLSPKNGPFRVQNLDTARTVRASATTGVVTLTANVALFQAGHVGGLIRLLPDSNDTVPLWTGGTALAVGGKMRNAGKAYAFAAGSGANTGVNPPTHSFGTEQTGLNPVTKWTYLDDGSGVARITAVAPGGLTATATVTKTLPQSVVDSPTYRWAEGAWSALYGYPSVVELFDQRAVYAATPTEPRTLFFSAIGDYEDFDPGELLADDAYTYTIAGDATINRVIWLKRGRAGLHIGALGEEYSAQATQAGQAIGPETTRFNTDSQIGSKPGIRPIAPNGRPIFVSKDGARVYEIAYNLQTDSNEAQRLSRPAQHLGATGFQEIVWASAPEPTAWLRRGDGTLAAMIYDPAEQVLGWAPYPVAGGMIESISVEPSADGGRDVLSMVVARVIGGATVRMIEEQADIYGLLTGAVPFVEAVHFFAAKIFTGAPAASFALPHLAGQVVYAWTDAGEYGPLTVANDGTVTLPVFVGWACIGLFDATHQAETLDLLGAANDGNTMGRRRRITPWVAVGLHRTAAAKIATVERQIGQPERQGQAMNVLDRAVASDLSEVFTGVTRVAVTSGLAEEISLRFFPVGGAPMTITAVVPPISEAGA